MVILKKSKEPKVIIELALLLRKEHEQQLIDCVADKKLSPDIMRILKLTQRYPELSSRYLGRAIQIALSGHPYFHATVKQTPISPLLPDEELLFYRVETRKTLPSYATSVSKLEKKSIYGLSFHQRSVTSTRTLIARGLTPFKTGEIVLLKECLKNKTYIGERGGRYYYKLGLISETLKKNFPGKRKKSKTRKPKVIGNKIVELGFAAKNIARIEGQTVYYV